MGKYDLRRRCIVSKHFFHVVRHVGLSLIISVAIAMACSNPAAPKDCVNAATEAGAPEQVIEFLNNPTGNLNQAEKFAIRQFLNRTSLNDVCGDALEKLE